MASTAAKVGLGVAVGYGAFKLFESMFGSNEPHQNQSNRSNDNDSQMLFQRPQIINRNQFGKNQEIHVVNTVNECRYSMRQLKA